MEKKKKLSNGTGPMGMRGRGGPRGKNIRTGQPSFATKSPWKRFQNFNGRGGFVQKKFTRNPGLTRSRSNLALNRIGNIRGNPRGGMRGMRGSRGGMRGGRGFGMHRGGPGRFGLTRSRSRTNLTFTQTGFFTNNKPHLNRTNSLPNLQDPMSVHNRLGYQSPAQVAYRNRVKKAKQLLLQRQNQRLDQRQNDDPVCPTFKRVIRILKFDLDDFCIARTYTT